MQHINLMVLKTSMKIKNSFPLFLYLSTFFYKFIKRYISINQHYILYSLRLDYLNFYKTLASKK